MNNPLYSDGNGWKTFNELFPLMPNSPRTESDFVLVMDSGVVKTVFVLGVLKYKHKHGRVYFFSEETET